MTNAIDRVFNATYSNAIVGFGVFFDTINVLSNRVQVTCDNVLLEYLGLAGECKSELGSSKRVDGLTDGSKYLQINCLGPFVPIS